MKLVRKVKGHRMQSQNRSVGTQFFLQCYQAQFSMENVHLRCIVSDYVHAYLSSVFVEQIWLLGFQFTEK